MSLSLPPFDQAGIENGDGRRIWHAVNALREFTIASFRAARRTVQVDAAGALSGDGSIGSPLAVVVDGVTIIIVGNQIQATMGGSGDVTGPAGAIDDRIVTMDGATGKLVQDGGQTIAQVIAASVVAALAASVTASSATQQATGDTSSTANTLVDIAGATLTLAAGTWLLTGTACFYDTVIAAAMVLQLTDAANTAYTGAQGTAAHNEVTGLTLRPHKITIAGATTFKLRMRSTTNTSIVLALDSVTSAPVTGIAAIRLL